MRILLRACAASLLALPAFAVTVSTVDKDAVESSDFSLSGGKVSGGPLDGTPAEDLVQVAFGASPAPAAAKAEVRLASGDVLWGDLRDSAADALSLDTPALGVVSLKLDQVQSVVYASRLAGAALAALQDRMASDRAGMDHDLCYLANGDRVRFYLRSLDAKSVKGEDDDRRPYEFPLEQVTALSLVSTAKPAPAGGLSVRLSTRDGGCLMGVLRSAGEGKLSLLHPVLGEIAVSQDACASLDVLNGRVVCLSDLAPAEAKERPYLCDPSRPAEEGALFRWRKDRQVVDGRPISIRGRRYSRGLGVHAYSELTFALDGAYARFRSDFGIDDSAGGGGNVEAAVLVDGKERFRAKATGRDPALPVSVDCRGGKRLTLVVDFGEDREILDRAAWAGAALVKERK